MTCDTSRPCRRCISRKLAETCEDAPRKRKKYLSDVPAALIRLHPDSDSAVSAISTENHNATTPQPQLFQATLFQQSNSLPGYLAPRHTELSKTLSNSETKKQGEFSDQNYGATGKFIMADNGLGKNNDLTRLNDNPRGQLLLPKTNVLFAGDNMDAGTLPNQSQYLSRTPESSGKDHARQSQSHHQEQDHMNMAFDQAIEHSIPHIRNRTQQKRTNFLSSAADLEYSTLSSILQDNFMGVNHTALATSTEGTPNSALSPALSPHAGQHMVQSPSSLATAGLFNNSLESRMQNETRNATLHLGNSSEYPPCDPRLNQYFLGAHPKPYLPEVLKALSQMRASDPVTYHARNSQLTISFAVSALGSEITEPESLLFKVPEEIYAKITRPFSYTPGFHQLIAYLRRRFPREMLVKMAKSMSVYRPSFIACTNSLHETDLVFMEQCFQRTLLTYDNFIKVSGTPTIVWRRTGEIAYVGKEFTALTGWTQEQIMGPKPMFIVELLDDKSVVEYFELFSRIAFGDFLGATMTECTLLTPDSDVKIRAGCIWTLKRDVFGIPMMIVGNFLPIV